MSSPETENDFVNSNGLNAKDEKRGSIKKSSSSQLNVTSIVNINEKDEHMNSIIRYQTLQPLHYSSNNKNSGRCLCKCLCRCSCRMLPNWKFR